MALHVIVYENRLKLAGNISDDTGSRLKHLNNDRTATKIIFRGNGIQFTRLNFDFLFTM